MDRSSVIIQLLAATALLGCQQRPQVDREEMREVWQHPGAGGAVAHPNSVIVAQGASPLLYQVQQAGTLHVTDTTNGSELATTVVQPGTIVWIDQDKGIFANKQKLRPGQLPGGHQYSISFDLETADAWRTGVEAPRPAPPAASQPANGPGH
jgi:hypothetical protein